MELYMGIHPYGLFGTNESNNPFGSDYELKRQLAARQAQLNALSKKDTLSSEDEKRKSQLNNAVNQLSTRINRTAPKTDSGPFNDESDITKSPSLVSSPDGRIIAKSPSPVSSSYGMFVAKSPSTVTTTDYSPKRNDDYLKGFFLDIKI